MSLATLWTKPVEAGEGQDQANRDIELLFVERIVQTLTQSDTEHSARTNVSAISKTCDRSRNS
jgi:hypothetical protein